MTIRFKYLQRLDDAMHITTMLNATDRNSGESLRTAAMLKMIDRSITADNILDYLNERYPERNNIEIAEIISKQISSFTMRRILLAVH